MVGGSPIVTYTNREPLALWRDTVRDACPIREPRGGPFGVSMLFRVARPLGHYGRDGGVLPRFMHATPDRRPDLDKYARAVIDALTGLVWRDDGQVTELMSSKRYGEPGVTIVIDGP
jgi:hypothetical protein